MPALQMGADLVSKEKKDLAMVVEGVESMAFSGKKESVVRVKPHQQVIKRTQTRFAFFTIHKMRPLPAEHADHFMFSLPLVDLEMEPHSETIDISHTALLIVDMQRDFLEEGGFGHAMGSDITKLQSAIKPCQKVLKAARKRDMAVFFTREDHRTDMMDVHSSKVSKQDAPYKRIKAIRKWISGTNSHSR